MKEDYKEVDPENIHVDQRKKILDVMHGIEIICKLGKEIQCQKVIKKCQMQAPVFMFAFFYICILVLIDSVFLNCIKLKHPL